MPATAWGFSFVVGSGHEGPRREPEGATKGRPVEGPGGTTREPPCSGRGAVACWADYPLDDSPHNDYYRPHETATPRRAQAVQAFSDAGGRGLPRDPAHGPGDGPLDRSGPQARGPVGVAVQPAADSARLQSGWTLQQQNRG